MEQKVLSGRAPTWVDVTQTCRSRANTGVQRVARSLLDALGTAALPVRWDSEKRCWRSLDRASLRRLQWGEDHRPSPGRSSAGRTFGNWVDRLESIFSAEETPPTPQGFITAEVFLPEVGNALPTSPSTGLRTAIFHDALPLLHPTLCSPSVLERFPLYLDQLRRFDRVLAVSEQSRTDLLAYWRWLGGTHPVVGRVHLPVRLPLEARTTPGLEVASVVSIGTLEPRKNHDALLEAAETLWREGVRVTLHLAGAPHRSTHGKKCARRIEQLQRAGRSLVWHRNASDRQLAGLLAQASFTVFPSLAEGYGLPIAESLAAGVPCLCGASGAMGELAAGGGCMTLGTLDAASLANGMRRLLREQAYLGELARQASAREFPRVLRLDPDALPFVPGKRRDAVG